ncbi:hypothetical protein PInf_012562 [Phytophthora infestans]|nr:hypothetical protein PInf_012562 [Phytophthora infestans]
MLLLWDDFSGHWTPEVVEYAASINISKLRKFWVDRLRQQVADHHALEVSRAAQRLGITTRTNTAFRLEMQDVARERVADIQREAPSDEANDEIPALVKELKKLGVVREEQDLTCDEDED